MSRGPAQSHGEETSSRKTVRPVTYRQSAVSSSINDTLKRALERAASPGPGDEEPEVMTDECSSALLFQHSAKSEEKMTREAEAAKLRQLFDEECRVAAMSFDQNAIIRLSENMKERSRYIPLRLSYEERKTLRLVNAAINVSDYTNVVDVPFKNAAKRQHLQLQQVVAFLSGIIAAVDYGKGQEVTKANKYLIVTSLMWHHVHVQVLVDRNFQPHESDIQDMLEIARRYKITNPEKMRSEYGKLVYLMQDAESEDIKPLLGIDVHRPIKTVYSFLEDTGCLNMLDDEHIGTATQGKYRTFSSRKSLTVACLWQRFFRPRIRTEPLSRWRLSVRSGP